MRSVLGNMADLARSLVSGAVDLLAARTPRSAAVDAGRRGEILRRFEAWLDEVLAEEQPPQGLDAKLLAELQEPASVMEDRGRLGDLYSTWSAMTALTQEVKLQGRAFSKLSDAVASLEVSLTAGGPEAISKEARRRTSREFLGLLLDIRERLRRGLESAGAHRSRAREGSGEVAAALEQGYRLGLERLEEELERLGVREIECAGRPFDPSCMRAVDVEERPDGPEGTVIEIYRAGYAWGGEVFRPAEVKVARLALSEKTREDAR